MVEFFGRHTAGQVSCMKKAGLLKILLAVLWAVFGFGASAVEAQPEKSQPEVTAIGGVSAPVIAKKEDLRFWFTIQNKTGSAISQVRMMHLPHGYTVEEVCSFLPQSDPKQSAEVKCAGQQEIAGGVIKLADTMNAAQSMTVAGRLKPDTPHKKENLTLVLEWTNTGQPLSSSLTVSLGENQVQNGWEKWSSSGFYQAVKDLALPLVLLGIGAWLNLSAKRRDARSETLKLMLPVSHNYAAKYYLPLSRATEHAVGALTKVTKSLQPASPLPSNYQDLEPAMRESFFFIILTKRVLEGTRKAVGGLYFKDLLGEELAAYCITEFNDLFGRDTEPLARALQRLSGMFKRTETYESFERRFWNTSSPPSEEQMAKESAWADFIDWVQEDEKRRRALQLLSSLAIILDFEANRPYGYWYDVMDGLKLARLDRTEPRGLDGSDYVNVQQTLLMCADLAEEDPRPPEVKEREQKKKRKEIENYFKGKRKSRFIRRLTGN
jgi:hypothetical protein